MPNRIIREAILSSERVASLGWAEEVLFRRLMSIVDDYGRHEANPKLLRSKCYPLQTDDVTVVQVSKWLASCQKAGVLSVYASDGKQYLELSNFGQQIRSASKCPAPDSICNHLPADAHLGVAVVESVVVSEVVDDKSSCSQPPADEPEPSVISFPLNTGAEWWFTEAKFIEYQALYPQADLMAELRKMRGWFLANPSKRKTKTGILRFVNSWLSKAQDENKPGTFSRSTNQPGKTMQALTALEEMKHGVVPERNHHGHPEAGVFGLGASAGWGSPAGHGNGLAGSPRLALGSGNGHAPDPRGVLDLGPDGYRMADSAEAD